MLVVVVAVMVALVVAFFLLLVVGVVVIVRCRRRRRRRRWSLVCRRDSFETMLRVVDEGGCCRCWTCCGLIVLALPVFVAVELLVLWELELFIVV